MQLGGTVAVDICLAAQELGVDLIMMTSHARSGVAHFVLGSVAEAVMHNSPVPTLILQRDGLIFPASDRDEPLTILVPLDGTSLAETALAPAVTLAAQVRGAIRVLRVLPAHTTATPTDRMLVEETHNYFARLRAFVEVQGVTMHESIAWGNVVAHIIATTQENQTDLIAIATHDRAGMAKLREGSITLEVLHHLATPMLVIHSSSPLSAPPPS